VTSLTEHSERVEIAPVVAGDHHPRETALRDELAHRIAFARPRDHELDDLPSRSFLEFELRREVRRDRANGLGVLGSGSIVERDPRPFALEANAIETIDPRPRREGNGLPAFGLAAPPAVGALAPIRACEEHARRSGSSAEIFERPSGDDRHECETACERDKRFPRTACERRILRTLDDRRERAVEVEEDPRRGGVFTKLRDGIFEVDR
jgi:hypothetical protein